MDLKINDRIGICSKNNAHYGVANLSSKLILLYPGASNSEIPVDNQESK